MHMRIALVALALALGACEQQASAPDGAPAPGPQLEAPAPETEPSRLFAPANDAATAATGQLTVSIALDLPDASQPGADAQEMLTLRGANGVLVEAAIAGAISPATQVQGRTLRSLFEIDVNEPQVLVYRLTRETRAEGGHGLCAEAASHVVVWEPIGPGEAVMKVLGLTGGAPGAAAARACPLLAYRRN